MPLSPWLAIAVLAFMPLAAHAQQTTRHSDPADPNASVPASDYVSAFRNYRAAADAGEAPDKIWRTVNDTVGQLKGHAGHIAQDHASGPEQAASEHHEHHAHEGPQQ